MERGSPGVIPRGGGPRGGIPALPPGVIERGRPFGPPGVIDRGRPLGPPGVMLRGSWPGGAFGGSVKLRCGGMGIGPLVGLGVDISRRGPKAGLRALGTDV
jgi:hypothetical protein